MQKFISGKSANDLIALLSCVNLVCFSCNSFSSTLKLFLSFNASDSILISFEFICISLVVIFFLIFSISSSVFLMASLVFVISSLISGFAWLALISSFLFWSLFFFALIPSLLLSLRQDKNRLKQSSHYLTLFNTKSELSGAFCIKKSLL